MGNRGAERGTRQGGGIVPWLVEIDSLDVAYKESSLKLYKHSLSDRITAWRVMSD